MSYTIYTDPTSATLAGLEIQSLLRVEWTVEADEILDNGDEDEVHSVARHGTVRTHGRIELLDAAEAAQLTGRRGSLQFTMSGADGSDRQVRIDEASLGRSTQAVEDQSAPRCRLEFIAPAAPQVLAV
jgi:hypothetical protein